MIEVKRQISLKQANLSIEQRITNAINEEYGIKDNPIKARDIIKWLETFPSHNQTYRILHAGKAYAVEVLANSHEIQVSQVTW